MAGLNLRPAGTHIFFTREGRLTTRISLGITSKMTCSDGQFWEILLSYYSSQFHPHLNSVLSMNREQWWCYKIAAGSPHDENTETWLWCSQLLFLCGSGMCRRVCVFTSYWNHLVLFNLLLCLFFLASDHILVN